MNNFKEQEAEPKITNVQEYPAAPAKKYQATPGKLLTLTVAIVAIGYMFVHLNRWFEGAKQKLDAKNNGRVPAVNIDTSNIVDDSCKTELYAEDGKSGLLDSLHIKLAEPETYELVGYELTEKKVNDRETSFVSNFADKTTDDLELHGFDHQESEYEITRPKKFNFKNITRFFTGDQEALL